MTKTNVNERTPAGDIIELGVASAETRGSNDHSFDGIEAQQLPKVGLTND